MLASELMPEGSVWVWDVDAQGPASLAATLGELQAMARLWLMRDEIEILLRAANTPDIGETQAMLDKLTSLGD